MLIHLPPSHSRLPRFATFFTMVISLMTILALVYVSHKLRPGSDDYCFGWISAQYGLIGGTAHWWNSWSGYLYLMFMASLLVGLPLAHLPFGIASAIPFLFSSVLLGVTVIALAPKVFVASFNRIFIFCLTIFLWWVFLWAPESFGLALVKNPPIATNENMLMAQGIVHWQTLNGEYVSALLVLLLVWRTLWGRVRQTNVMLYAAFFLLGLVTGQANITLAVSVIACALLASLICLFFQISISRARIIQCICFLLAVLISMLLSHFLSPGAQLRKEMLGSSFQMSAFGIVNLVYFVSSFSFKLWFLSYFNVGALLTVFIAASYAFLCPGFISGQQVQKLVKLGIGLGIFALIQILVNRLSEAFVYVGYWHYVSALVCIFISLLFFGLAIGRLLRNKVDSQTYQMLAAACLIGGLLVGVSSAIFMVEVIYLRETSWALGAAPTEGVTDIEDPKGWQMNCWNHLNELRPAAITRQPIAK